MANVLSCRLFSVLLITLSLVLMFPMAAVADPPDPPLDPPVGWFVLPPSVTNDINSVFADNFTIYVDWDGTDLVQYPTEADWPWQKADILAFTNRVMPLNPGDPSINGSLADLIVQYFGRDFNSAYEEIELDLDWTGYDCPGICHTYMCIGTSHSSAAPFMVPTPPDGFTIIYIEYPDGEGVDSIEYLDATFAHEYSHVVYFSRKANFVAWTGYESVATEFLAQYAEYKSGWFDMPEREDVPINRSIAPTDYWVDCFGNAGDLKHATWSLFAPYLVDHYRLNEGHLNDFADTWIQNKPYPENPDLIRWDLWALANQRLEDWNYAQFFEPEYDTGEKRLRRMYQHYALSLFVNNPTLEGVPSYAAQWAQGENPGEVNGFLRDWNDRCWNDAWVKLLYHTVSEQDSSTGHFIYPHNIYDPDDVGFESCAEGGYYAEAQPHLLQVSEYSHAYHPFVASDSLSEDTFYNLRVDLSFHSTYPCPTTGTTMQSVLGGDEVLHLWVLGYPEATTELQEHGDEAEIVFDYEHTGMNPQQDLSIAIPGLASDYASFVLILSLTDDMITAGAVNEVSTLPYTYSFWAEDVGQGGTIAENTTWPDDLFDPGVIFPADMKVWS